ncbi:MAG TPA: MFS transporter [Solirubrobacteraceae bacterium]|jgi:EmrB/QacA subfamily drug resistance transporter|nr:MFS transporter [Solirubrobacteraceae bacterium]
MSATPAGSAASRPLAAVRQAEPSADSRHALLLTACCLAQFMVILDIAIVNVALPSIQSSLGFSAPDLQWVVNAYTITFAGFLMLSGRAADLLGHRRTFVSGLLIFSLASLIGGTAASSGVLVGARALQGLGGAIMAAGSLTIITSSFAAGHERNRAIALWGAMNGAGGATGTLLGGIITQEFSWRWILLINLPIGIAVALIARVVVSDRRSEREVGGFDLAGALSVTTGLLALVYGIVTAGSHGWGSLEALGPIALGLALLAAFVIVEARVAVAPLVPLKVFSNRLLRVSNIAVVLLSAALFPMWYFASLYLQEVLHMRPLEAGLAFLPMSLTIFACAMQAGRLVARFGAGRVLGCGLSLMAVGLALFGRVSVGGNYVSDFLLPSLLVSTGIGLSIVPSTIAATATAAPGEAGLASGLVNTSRQVGGALGLAILASLAVLYTNHLTSVDYLAPIVALNDGFHLAFLLGGGFAAAGALVAFRFIPRTTRPPGQSLAPAGRVAVDDVHGSSAAGRSLPEDPPAVRVVPMPERRTARRVQAPAIEAGEAQAGSPAVESAPGQAAFGRRPARKPFTRVVLSVAGAESWALAPGSMTVSTTTDESGRAS